LFFLPQNGIKATGLLFEMVVKNETILEVVAIYSEKWGD